MRPPPVIVDCPIPNRHLQMAFVEGNQEVETFTTQAAAQSLAHRVCLGGSHRCPQNSNTQVRETLVELMSEDAIAIVDDEAIGMVTRQRFPELGSVHSAVGWAVALRWRIWRDPISMTTKT